MVIKSSREKIDRRESGGSEEGEGKEGEMGGAGRETEQYIRYSQNVVPVPAASVLPGNLLQWQIASHLLHQKFCG